MAATPEPAPWDGLALRLATAIMGTHAPEASDLARRAVLRARARARETGGDWLALLAATRSEATAARIRATASGAGGAPIRAAAPDPIAETSPAPRYPGDGSHPWLPVDPLSLHDALSSLSSEDQSTLWDELLGRSDRTVEALAGALERLHAALRAASFPSAEDIP